MALSVHQITAGAAPGDAITHHVLRARDLLREAGYRSEVYAEAVHADISDEIHTHAKMPNRADLVILHYSIGSRIFDLALDRYKNLALHYHNITPAHLLWRHAPMIARACAAGRQELPRFARGARHAWAVSAFNAEELREAGARAPVVAGILRPPFAADGGRQSDPGLDDSIAPRLLFVGRGVPNKAQHDLILTVAALHEVGVPATLRMVGSWDGAPAYEEYCQTLARSLGIADSVQFAGRLSDAGLRQAYRDADLFLCLSDHEGFCVPLLEAMETGLPVVCFNAGAVAETVGDAGLVLSSKEPSMVAEATIEVLGNRDLRESFARCRPERLDALSASVVGDRILGLVRSALRP